MDKYLKKIKKLSTLFLQNENMAKHTTFACGGKARFYLETDKISKLVKILKILKKIDAKYFILGAGSNTLFKDFAGFVLCTKQLDKIKIKNNFVFCQCGVSLLKLNGVLAKNNLGGLEFSFGIPASIGGACTMNAGAFGGQIGDFVQSVKIFDGKKVRVLSKDKLCFEYRSSNIKTNNWIVLQTCLTCKHSQSKEIFANMQNFMKKRIDTQPTLPSAGSVFKRNGDIIPAKIIDNLGLKGVKINGAEISPKHAGFIVNNGNASSQDVENLIFFIKNKVKSECNIDLQTEIEIVGDTHGSFG